MQNGTHIGCSSQCNVKVAEPIKQDTQASCSAMRDGGREVGGGRGWGVSDKLQLLLPDMISQNMTSVRAGTGIAIPII